MLTNSWVKAELIWSSKEPREDPEGRPGAPVELKTVGGIPLALLLLRGPSGLPSELLALGPRDGARGAIAGGGVGGQSPTPSPKS